MTDEKNIQKENEEEQEGVPHFVTPLQSITIQVGEHVLSAMEHDDTVAVLTTITGSTHGKQVISIPLNAEHVQHVHALISEIHESEEPDKVPCVGFHCYIDQDDPADS